MSRTEEVTVPRLDKGLEPLIRAGRELGAGDRLVVDMSAVRSVYANGAVPFASALAFFRERGVILEFVGSDRPQIAGPHILAPLSASDAGKNSFLMHKVWQYSSEGEAQKLAELFVEALVDEVRCESGVVDTFNWCLYEVMDNVFQHSHAHSGFVMMQIHHASRLAVVSIGDSGRGIQRSLLESPVEGLDRSQLVRADRAINYAIQKGVTSKGKNNQGNGLYGLKRAVELNGGELTITSGRGFWTTKSSANASDPLRPVLDAEDHHSTLVDWQLQCAAPVRIEEALGKSSPMASYFDALETDEGYLRVPVTTLSSTVGSRSEAKGARNRLFNYALASNAAVVLDFGGVGVISSSFADEVLGKLAVEMTEPEFRRRIFIDNASQTNRALIDTAVARRLASGM